MPEPISPQLRVSRSIAEHRPAADASLLQHNSDARRSARVRVVAIGATAFLILLILLSLIVDIVSARNVSLAAAERTTQSLARVMDEQTTDSLNAIDAALAAAVAAVRPLSRRRQLDHASVAEVLRESDRALPAVRTLWITNAAGDTIHESEGLHGQNHLPDREYFRVQRDNPKQGLYVGGPVLGQSGEWFIVLSRRIDDAEGRFAGVAAAALATSHLQRFYESLDFGREGAVALMHRDGTLIARAPPMERSLGQKLRPPPPFVGMLPHAPSGTYRGVSAVDQVSRTYAYRSIKGGPLVVLVGLGERESLIGWRTHAEADAVTSLAFVLVIASLGYLLVRELQRRDVLSEALAFDIAERKKAEADRLALQERDHALTRALGQVIYDWLPLADKVSWEGEYTRLLGYSAAEMGQDTATRRSRLHPEDVEETLAELEAAARERRVYDHEYRLRHRDGHYVWVHDRAVPFVNDDGQLIRLIGVVIDISARKKAETDRLALLERDHALTRALGQIIYDWRPLMDQILWEGDYTRIFGYSAAEMGHNTASWSSRVHPDDLLGAWAAAEAAAREHRVLDHEYRLRHRDGHYVWVHDRGVPFVNADGQVIRLLGVVVDISARKKAEADRLALLERDHALTQALGQIIYDWAPLADRVSWEGEYTRLLGYSAAEMGQDTGSWSNRLHPDDVAGAWAEIEASTRERRIYDYEYRLRHRDGHYVWLHDRAVPFVNAAGELTRLLGVVIDISARKKAEADRLALLERDHALAQALGQIIYDWSPLADRVSWGGDYMRVLGYSATEVGQNAVSWSSRVHPDDLNGAVAETKAATRERRIYDHEYRLRHRDGHYVWVHDRAVTFVNADGRLTRLIGVMIDVSARKAAEQELKDHAERLHDLSKRLMEVEESERRRINQELHDRIGQSLSTLSLNLTLIRARLPEFSAGELGSQIDEEQKLLESTIVQVRNVMAELHPLALEEFGLRAALRIFSSSFSARVGIPITVRGADLAPRLPPAVELCLFRVAQEALANSAKHAHAKHIEVQLDQSDELVTLTVSDDGTGFDSWRRGEASYGLAIMHERAEAAGIALDIESAPGRGTRVIARAKGIAVD